MVFLGYEAFDINAPWNDKWAQFHHTAYEWHKLYTTNVSRRMKEFKLSADSLQMEFGVEESWILHIQRKKVMDSDTLLPNDDIFRL